MTGHTTSAYPSLYSRMRANFLRCILRFIRSTVVLNIEVEQSELRPFELGDLADSWSFAKLVPYFVDVDPVPGLWALKKENIRARTKKRETMTKKPFSHGGLWYLNGQS